MLLLVFEGSHNREDRDEGFVSFFEDSLFCGAHGEFLVYTKAQIVEVGDLLERVRGWSCARWEARDKVERGELLLCSRLTLGGGGRGVERRLQFLPRAADFSCLVEGHYFGLAGVDKESGSFAPCLTGMDHSLEFVGAGKVDIRQRSST